MSIGKLADAARHLPAKREATGAECNLRSEPRVRAGHGVPNVKRATRSAWPRVR